jgi:hypothetical protein
MDQPALFHESVSDALREVVRALGGAKQVGHRMRPDLAIDHAARWVSDCLNDDRREHFTPSQVLWLLSAGREAGCHVAMGYLAAQAGYAEPVPLQPEDERAKLQHEFMESVKTLSRISEALGLDHKLPAAMRVVK